MAGTRTHVPSWNGEKCLACGACTRRCPSVLFTEQAQEADSLRGKVARLNIPPRPQPPCQQACPLKQDVSAYVGAISSGDFERARQVVTDTNPLPGVCGYVCSHPCQRACVRSRLESPVPIRLLKATAVEYGTAPPLERAEDSGFRVAVVGAGPAGLSAAFFLARAGHSVDVFDEQERPGGLLRSAVPTFDLPPDVLDRDLEPYEKLGVRFHKTRVEKGDFERLRQGHDAVVLAVGAGMGTMMGIAGEDLRGCTDAVGFCRRIRSGERIEGPAVVFGAGHMAAAAARAALRAGAAPVELHLGLKKRTAAEPDGIELAVQEGVKVVTGTKPVSVEGSGSVERVVFDTAGGRAEVRAAHFVAAVGRKPQGLVGELVEVEPNGTARLAPGSCATSVSGVFCCGEAATGVRDVVHSLASGMRAAREVDEWLRKRR